MTRSEKKARAAEEERRAKVNMLSLALFELNGKLAQVVRLATAAGAEGVVDQCLSWEKQVGNWRVKLHGVQKKFAVPQTEEE